MSGSRLFGLLAGVALAAPLAAACSGGSNFPDPPPCEDPSPTPAVSEVSGNPDLPYLVALDNGIDRLAELTHEFELRWPGRRFSSTPEFRQEFVVYAGESKCLAESLMALTPSDTARLGEFDDQVDAGLARYLEVLEQGRTAVRKRNVSEYRRFHNAIDDVHDELRATFSGVPR